MTKRMTLLARKEGTCTSDFRSYWAGPHAGLALGMPGITSYVHNRVDKLLWASDGQPAFDVDGIVELCFAGAEEMRLAQASNVGRKFIPADEPLFLKGWTLCVVDTEGDDPGEPAVKVMVPFHAPAAIRRSLFDDLRLTAADERMRVALNWTLSTAKRERLWAEPNPPSGFVCVWFESVAQAHEAFEPGAPLRLLLEQHLSGASAYLVDVLAIR